MTMRIETLMMLAEIRNSHNHYVLKNANIYDRALRDTGTTAQRNAFCHLHGWEQARKTGCFRGEPAAKGPRRMHGGLRKGVGGMRNSVNRESTNSRGYNSETWTNLGHIAEDTIRDPELRRQLAFDGGKYQGSYERVVSTPKRIGRRPEVSYEENRPPPARESGNIWWGIIRWSESECEHFWCGKRSWRKCDVRVATESMQGAELAIGITNITWKYMTGLQRRHIIGREISVNPTCLEGVCLTIGVQNPLRELATWKVTTAGMHFEENDRYPQS